MAGGEQRRERKVVSVLFCDLVGFTTRAESMDPEDVEALLRPYHERVRSELERHGGTVEKFIGDAVMALFGAPVAHEDDAERAARAALAIRDFALEEELELRVGITTGEALVSLDANPAGGEGMASGDVVNTAARLQSAAPVNGILADETTYRATRHAIDYDDAEPVEAKGKSEPIAVWEATAARSRFGVDVAHEARSELVGRERELAVVRDAFDRARHARTTQLLTLVGVPGIGKSRLVHELWRIVDADEELITWRQGRCLAYGDGVTMWALAEIVKAQAGIAEQDTPADVAGKLGRAAADAVPEADSEWVESHLLALTGLAEEAELGDNRRNEAFSAWRRFLEGLAEQRPLVLVFEDLHWADESLLDFVDEIVDWITDVPLLVVATARPELLERRPSWGGGKLNATTLALSPLTDEQTAQLLALVLGRPVLPAESQAALLERAGGNPLYAEQFAELYVERGSTDELPLPETLQGIIAARLDGLGAIEKELLLDAAVVGKVFWPSALGREDGDPTAAFHSLERKGFVRRQRRSSVEGESELAFAHALVRDVAYGQIPRAQRAEKHQRVAEWIESLGRPDDHAEMVAHHWQAALEFARAAGQDGDDLADRTRLALRDAGDRAFALNAYATAEKYYAEALASWPDAEPGRPDLLFRRARSLHLAGDDRRQPALEEARDALLEVGAVEPAAEAEAFLAQAAWYRGDRADAEPHFARAYALVADARCVCVESARARTGRALPDACGIRRGGDSCRPAGTRAGRDARPRRAARARADDDRIRPEPHRAGDGQRRSRGGARHRPGRGLAFGRDDAEQPRGHGDLGGGLSARRRDLPEGPADRRALRRQGHDPVHARELDLRVVCARALGRSDRRRRGVRRRVRFVAALRRGDRPRGAGVDSARQGRRRSRSGGSRIRPRARAQDQGPPEAYPFARRDGGEPGAPGAGGRGTNGRGGDDRARTGERRDDRCREPVSSSSQDDWDFVTSLARSSSALPKALGKTCCSREYPEI